MSWRRGRLRRGSTGGEVHLNVVPLIDVVFFLLIFYVISTSFVAESSVPVSRPEHGGASPVAGGFVPVAIVKSGAIVVGERAVALDELVGEVRAALARAGVDRVLVIPDREVPTGTFAAVMDRCQQAGARDVSMAVTRPEGR